MLGGILWTSALLPPSPRLLPWTEYSLGPTFPFFSICQHKYQLQHFNEGSFHGDGSGCTQGGAQTKATRPLHLVPCGTACFKEVRLAAGQGEGDAQGFLLHPSPAGESYLHFLFLLTDSGVRLAQRHTARRILISGPM